MLQSGRKHLKARQRGVDGSAFSQLVMMLPMALISLIVVAVVTAFIPAIGTYLPLMWLLSGVLVFNSAAERAIAQHLLRMRRPGPADAQRLAEVWGEVTRRAGVRSETYELWIQERAELNATAVSGHIVGVTRHAMDQLPNSQLAAVLAHELGHHVGGHTWVGLLVDWYALPARTAGRWTGAVLSKALKASVGCGGCLVAVAVAILAAACFDHGLWWLALSGAIAPPVISWLHRRGEFRADRYAVGLGFGEELEAVLVAEHQRQAVAAPAVAAPRPQPGWPQQMGNSYQPQAPGWPSQPTNAYSPQAPGWPPQPGSPYQPQTPGWPTQPGSPYPPQTPGWPPAQPQPGYYPPAWTAAPGQPKPKPAESLARAAHRNVEARLKHLRRDREAA
ncbi:M48 family metalloprotease [Kitasatospora sp. NBC_01266]|uniref:M48 family metalloprotease n=1 Tax=Kitasatospora sp. NBC_01266 TaxID=2903572 RepID=UPI002E31D5F8|nr:M48 family metalloprotease [Kitasatospora sp. NBC_01266]